jgi:hypothetical protein
VAPRTKSPSPVTDTSSSPVPKRCCVKSCSVTRGCQFEQCGGCGGFGHFKKARKDQNCVISTRSGLRCLDCVNRSVTAVNAARTLASIETAQKDCYDCKKPCVSVERVQLDNGDVHFCSKRW